MISSKSSSPYGVSEISSSDTHAGDVALDVNLCFVGRNDSADRMRCGRDLCDPAGHGGPYVKGDEGEQMRPIPRQAGVGLPRSGNHIFTPSSGEGKSNRRNSILQDGVMVISGLVRSWNGA